MKTVSAQAQGCLGQPGIHSELRLWSPSGVVPHSTLVLSHHKFLETVYPWCCRAPGQDLQQAGARVSERQRSPDPPPQARPEAAGEGGRTRGQNHQGPCDPGLHPPPLTKEVPFQGQPGKGSISSEAGPGLLHPVIQAAVSAEGAPSSNVHKVMLRPSTQPAASGPPSLRGGSGPWSAGPRPGRLVPAPHSAV